MKAKSILGKVIVVLVALGFIVYGSLSMINAKNSPVDFNDITTSDMTDKAYVSGKAVFSSDCYLTVSHSINYIIPTGKEYYYIVFNEDMTECMSYRGSKKFFENFDKDGFSKDGVEIKGKIRRTTTDNYRAISEINSNINQYGIQSYNISTSYYIDGKTDMLNIIAVILGALILLVFVLYCIAVRVGRENVPMAMTATILISILMMFPLAMIFFLYL